MTALHTDEKCSPTTGVGSAFSTVCALSLNHSQNSLSTIPGWFVKFLNISLLVILLVLPAGCGSAPEPPNLVLVSLDTLRADRLGCYGYQRDTSPKLDLFAADSVLFEYAVSQANETVRSHRSLFTSIYPTESLSRRDRRLMADTLREAGFATGGFTDGGPMGKDYGFHQGFDEFAEWGHGIEMKCRQALKWLDGLPSDQRFFLFIHCFDIHAPYAPPAPWRDHFGEGKPGGIKPKETAEICRRIREIDASGPALREGIRACPTIIKPNRAELAGLAGTALPDERAIVDYCLKLQDRVPIVLVSLGPDGIIMVESGRATAARPPAVEVRSTVGAGDCAVAGFLAGMLKDDRLEDCLRRAVAAGTAATLNDATGLCRCEDVDTLLPQTRVEVLKP